MPYLMLANACPQTDGQASFVAVEEDGEAFFERL